jgi:hypothetical protein
MQTSGTLDLASRCDGDWSRRELVGEVVCAAAGGLPGSRSPQTSTRWPSATSAGISSTLRQLGSGHESLAIRSDTERYCSHGDRFEQQQR